MSDTRHQSDNFQFSENKSIMDMKETFAIYVFRYKDWEPLTKKGITQKFDTEEEAETFVKHYPLWGTDFGRAVRQGNWQICPDQ